MAGSDPGMATVGVEAIPPLTPISCHGRLLSEMPYFPHFRTSQFQDMAS
jgi:hypothetical protein